MQNLGVNFDNGTLNFAPHAGIGNLVQHLSAGAGLDHTGGHVGSWLADSQTGGLLPWDSTGTGYAEAGQAGGVSHAGPDAAMLGSGQYVTGGVSTTNLQSGLLNSATTGTGFNPDATQQGLLNPALANVPFSAAPVDGEAGLPT